MAATDCISVKEYPGGVLCIDSGLNRDRMACCYVVESGEGVAIIETGVNASVARVLNVLSHRGWSRASVRYVIPTHVHLDHAGGVGGLMRSLPEATLLVHPRGAGHMIDPSRLEAGVREVYGDAEFERMYGELIPVAEERVHVMEDGESVSIGSRTLEFMDAPGHAKHHFSVWDEHTRGWFAGDNFGLSYRELDTARGPFIFPTTTPIDFDPPVLKNTMRRMMDREPRFMYLTHYGRVGDVERLHGRLAASIEIIAEIAERHEHREDRRALIARDFADWLYPAVRSHGVEIEHERLKRLLEPDVDLNAQGVDVWLTRRARRREEQAH